MSPRTKEQNEAIKEQTRQKILEAAVELFAKKGTQKVKITEIAKAAGVSNGLLYQYFKNKDDLQDYIKEVCLEQMEEDINQIRSRNTPSEKLNQLIDDIIEYPEQINYWRVLAYTIIQEAEGSTVKLKLNQFKAQIDKETMIMFQQLGYLEPEKEAFFFLKFTAGLYGDYTIYGDNEELKLGIDFLKSRYKDIL